MLIDTNRVISDYHEKQPEPGDKTQQVSFGTSGHGGTSLNATFTESHIAAITQALVEHRREKKINGLLLRPLRSK